MKKGFTLVELLAVIVILAIIAVITIPIISNVIEKSKLGSIKDSAYGIKKAAEIYYGMNQNLENEIIFECSNNVCSSNDKKLDFKGKVDSGKVLINKFGKVQLCITNDNYAASIDLNSSNVKASIDANCEEYELIYDSKQLAEIKQHLKDKNIINSVEDQHADILKQIDDLDLDTAKNDLYELKTNLKNNGIIDSIDDSNEQILNQINNIEYGRSEDQLKTELYNTLQYSGLVTKDMTYDQMLGALSKAYPAGITLVDYSDGTNLLGSWTYYKNYDNSSAGVSFGSTGLVISTRAGNGQNASARYCSNAAIDLSKYKTMEITVTGVSLSYMSNSGSMITRFGIRSNYSTGDINYTKYIDLSRGTHTIDISSINGAYYFAAALYASSGDVTISKIRLLN